ncbi:MAG TPA: hypothetical protein VGB84_04400 [Arachidicoccus sp.]
MYAHAENAMAVLNDLKNSRSYMYNGALAGELGIYADSEPKEIDSI